MPQTERASQETTARRIHATKNSTFLAFDATPRRREFYTSHFKNLGSEYARHGDARALSKGFPDHSFQLDGQEFAPELNGGPQFKFTEAVSQSLTADTPEKSTTWRTSEGRPER